MNYFFPGQASNLLQANVVALADNSAIITGDVYFYLRPRIGTYAGYWWDGANEEWSETEVSAGTATYIGGAVWELEIDNSDCWLANTSYTLYWAESGDLHRPDSDVVVPSSVAYDGTVVTTPSQGVVDICNYALAIVGTVGQADVDALDIYDGNPAADTALHAMAWCQRLYPFARNYAQIKLRPAECLKYVDPGAALDDSALTTPGWGYLYSRPASCLEFIAVVVDDSHDKTSGTDVALSYIEVGNQIACDYDDDILFKYTMRGDDCTRFSEGLKILTAHRLAYLIARPMGVAAAGRLALLREFQVALTEARGLTGRRTHRPVPERTLLTAHRARPSHGTALADPNGTIQMI